MKNSVIIVSIVSTLLQVSESLHYHPPSLFARFFNFGSTTDKKNELITPSIETIQNHQKNQNQKSWSREIVTESESSFIINVKGGHNEQFTLVMFKNHPNQIAVQSQQTSYKKIWNFPSNVDFSNVTSKHTKPKGFEITVPFHKGTGKDIGATSITDTTISLVGDHVAKQNSAKESTLHLNHGSLKCALKCEICERK